VPIASITQAYGGSSAVDVGADGVVREGSDMASTVYVETSEGGMGGSFVLRPPISKGAHNA
jgi:hypothetical protein